MAADDSGNKPNLKEFVINGNYLTQEFGASIRAGIEGSLPFPHAQLLDFVENVELVDALRTELLSAKYFRNENDLYSLSQTLDLKSFDAEKYPFLYQFRQFMSTTVRDFLQSITGFELNTQVAITGSKYSDTDLLLPHDDSLDLRRIAFVFYLTPNWKEEYGGQLALYNADTKTNRPSSVAKTLLPVFNSFLFFPVATNTWHSVQEIFSKDTSRLSLNGWFHADDAKASAAPKPEAPIQRLTPSLDITLEDVNIFINPGYIIPSEQKAIKRRFAAKSELYLEKFLNAEIYTSILAELTAAKFDFIGPPDRRNVAALNEFSINKDGSLSTLLRLFRSEAMTLLLTQWTGLKLHELKKASDSTPPTAKRPRLSGDAPSTSNGSNQDIKPIELVSSLYRFEHGSYTMTDQQLAADAKSNGYCLDVLLFFGDFEAWNDEAGGFVTYIAVDDPNAILKVPPRPNCAAVVFREPDILNFTKYVNHLSNSQFYYVLSCSFFGVASDEESEDSLESGGEEEHEEMNSDTDEDFDEEEGLPVEEETAE